MIHPFLVVRVIRRAVEFVAQQYWKTARLHGGLLSFQSCAIPVSLHQKKVVKQTHSQLDPILRESYERETLKIT